MRIGSLEYDVTGDDSGLKRVLAESIAEAEAAARTIGSLDATVDVDANMRGLTTKIAEAEALVKALDGQDVDIEFTGDAKSLTSAVRSVRRDLSSASVAAAEHDAKLAKLRVQYNKAASDLSKLRKLKWPEEGDTLRMAQLGKEMDLTSRKIRSLGGDVKDIAVDSEDVDRRWRRWLGTMGRTRISLGPVSTSLRGLAIIFSTLGPVILGVIGTASALVGVLGTGLAGAVAVSTGAVSGFGLALVGLLPSLKQLFAEAKAAPSITRPLQQMRDTLTAGIRKPFFETAHAAIRTLQADFPVFQRGATAAFGAASQGVQKWLTGLRSPEARQIIQTLLQNLTNSLPPLMEGLGHVGTAIARIGQSGSKFLPGLNQGFNQWAINLERSIGSGNALDQRIGRLVSHMREVGHFAQASGRLLVGFFGAGANTGAELLRSLTATFNQWNAWMRSVEGQRSLQNFFTRSADLARQLFPAIARIGTAFANLSTAAAPATQGAATALNGIAKAAALVPPPLLQAAGAALILSKAFSILKVDALVTAFSRLLPFLSTMRVALGVGGLATAAEVGTAALAGIVSPALAAGAAFGGIVIGAKLLSDSMDGVSEETQQAIDRYHAMVSEEDQLQPRLKAHTEALGAMHKAQAQYNKTVQESGPHSKAATDALIKLNQATTAYNKTIQPLDRSIKATFQDATGESARSLNNFNHYLRSSDTFLEQYARSQAETAGKGAQFDAALMRNGRSVKGVIQSLKAVGLSARQVGLTDLPVMQNALQQFNQTQQGAAARLVNTARAIKGLAPIAAQASGQIGKFIQTFGQVKGAKRAVISTNAPQQAAQIAKVSNNLQKLGAKKAVIRILAEGGPAGKVLDSLQKKQDGITRKRAVAKVDAKDNATPQIGRIKSQLDQVSKDHQAVIHLLGAPAAVAAAHQATAAVNAFPTGTRTMNLVTRYSTIGHPPGHYAGGVLGFAQGGALDRMMERAYNSAERRAAKKAEAGTKVTRPTFITGEEGRTEYVIATNPAYRQSNLDYLRQAARDLGQVVMPGYKKGGAHKAAKKGGGKGGKKKGPGPDIGENLDNATGSDSEYARLENLVQYDSGIVDLLKNKLDVGQASVSDVQGAINTEIADYGLLLARITQMLPGSKKEGIIPVPPKPGKKAKGAKKKKAQRAHDAAIAHNQAVASNYYDLVSELNTIRDVTIPQLILDRDSVASGGGAAPPPIGAQTLAFNQARQELFRTMGSNISQIIGSGLRPTVQPLTPGTIGYFPGTTLASSSGVGVASSGSFPGGMGPQGNTFINNFAAPPPDPFTWTQQQQFTVQAV